MRCLGKFLSLVGVFLVCALQGAALGQTTSSNSWSSIGQMTQPRTGAAAVLLPNGNILITGGSDASGVPQASAEIYSPRTATFSAASPMNLPRANHAAIVLDTGDVLVTGGNTTGGGYSDSAEIYSAATGQWTLLQASLGQGLASHAMANLPDGNVLIAGGQSTVGVVNSILLFRNSDHSITPIGQLLTARTGAVAAATPDGRVLIAGGSDINGAALASTEIFTYSAATSSGAIAAGPNMSYPRTGATATSTYDGVAIIGGNNGSADLGTAEIFSQWTNAFRLVSGGIARSGHFAVLLPSNGGILAMGGTGGQAVDLLQPWANSLAGAFALGANSLTNQNGGFAVPASLGFLLAAGGQSDAASSAEAYRFPTIATDQADYPPGTPVVMTGTGFQPGEIVDLHLHVWVNQTTSDLPDYTVTAGADGTFTFDGYAPDTTDLGARYHLTAVGESSGLQAQVIFTDGPATKVQFATSGLPAGASISVSYAGTNNGGNSASGSVTFLSPGPSSATGFQPDSNLSYTFPSSVTANGTQYVLTGTSAPDTCSAASGNSNCFAIASSGTQTVTATYILADQLSSVSVGAQIGTLTYGTAGSATYSVTVTPVSGNTAFTADLSIGALPSGVTASWSSSSLTFGASAAAQSVTLTLSTSTAAAAQTGTSFTVTATNHSLSTDTKSNTGSLTIGQAGATLSVINSPVTYNGSARSANVQGSVAGTVSNVTYTGTSGTTYGPSTAAPTNAGSYAVSANFTPADTTDYQTLTSASAGIFVINKANVTVNFSNIGPFTYNGSAQSPSFTVTGVNSTDLTSSATDSFNGTGSTTYSSSTAPTNAGTYLETVTFAATDNYNAISSGNTQTFTINKADVKLAFSNIGPFTYNGSAQSPGFTLTGVNSADLSSSATASYSGTQFDATSYGPVATAPTNGGNYTLTVTFATTDNYNAISSGNTQTFTINKADVKLAFSNIGPFTFNGGAQSPSFTLTGVNGADLSSSATKSYSGTQFDSTAYGPVATAPTNGGNYTLTVTFTGTDNYNAISSGNTQTFTINKADVKLAFSNIGPFTYNGSAQSPTYAVTGVNSTVLSSSATASYSGTQFDATSYGPVATAPTNGGNYTLTVTFAATDNYNAISSGNTQTFTINKADVKLAFSNIGPFTYNGSAQSPTYAVTGVNSTVLTSSASANYSGSQWDSTAYSSTGAPINGGQYTLTVTFAGNNNYNALNSSNAQNFTINKATPALSKLTASQTIVVGTPSVTLSGVISATGPIYPPAGEAVSISINNGTPVSATISGSGSFNAAVNTASLPISQSTYAISYSYPGDNNFFPAADSSTALSVKYASGGTCDGDFGHQILQPISVSGSSVFKSNSTTPAKFRVCDANGVSIGTPGVVQLFQVIGVMQGTSGTPDTAVASTNPDAAFRWDPNAQQWIFNISNKNLGPANQTYIFLITLNDGSTIPFQYGLR